MNDASLTELERTQGEANMKFAEATAAKEAAANHLAEAEQAYYDALENYPITRSPIIAAFISGSSRKEGTLRKASKKVIS